MIDTMKFHAALDYVPDDKFLISNNKQVNIWNLDGMVISQSKFKDENKWFTFESSISKLYNIRNIGLIDNFPLIPISEIDSFINEMIDYYNIDVNETFVKRIDISFDVPISYNTWNFRMKNAILHEDQSGNNGVEFRLSKDQTCVIYPNNESNGRPKGIRIENKFERKNIGKRIDYASQKNVIHYKNMIHDQILNRLSYHSESDFIINHPEDTISEYKKKKYLEIICNMSTSDFHLEYKRLKSIGWNTRKLRQLENERIDALKFRSFISNKDQAVKNIINTLNKL
jgi:hypothetical protein